MFRCRCGNIAAAPSSSIPWSGAAEGRVKQGGASRVSWGSFFRCQSQGKRSVGGGFGVSFQSLIFFSFLFFFFFYSLPSCNRKVFHSSVSNGPVISSSFTLVKCTNISYCQMYWVSKAQFAVNTNVSVLVVKYALSSYYQAYSFLSSALCLITVVCDVTPCSSLNIYTRPQRRHIHDYVSSKPCISQSYAIIEKHGRELRYLNSYNFDFLYISGRTVKL
jgi:hypothetical protein